MVKVEEAKPFIPVSLWDHMNPFLFSFHSQVVLQTAHHISIDPESSGSSGSVRPVSPKPSVTAWPALGLLISFSRPPLTCFCFCSFSFSTSRPPFQPHILFFCWFLGSRIFHLFSLSLYVSFWFEPHCTDFQSVCALFIYDVLVLGVRLEDIRCLDLHSHCFTASE